MFFLTLQAHPKTSSELYGEVDGAFVSCWANEPTPELAEASARAMIEENGWDVSGLDEVREVERRQYEHDPASLELFDQASTDGLLLTFHTWPIGGDSD